MSAPALQPPPLASFGGAIEFIFTPQSSNVTGGKQVGGIDQVIELTLAQLEVTVLALALSLLVALPVGLYLGHRGVGELLAIGIGNAGRAVPELALIAFMAAAIGVGVLNLTIALAVLGYPTHPHQRLRRHPPGRPGHGRRRSRDRHDRVRDPAQGRAAACRTHPLRRDPRCHDRDRGDGDDRAAGRVESLGDFILGENVYGSDGVLAGAIVVALLALTLEFAFAGLQGLLTSEGLRPKTT